MLYMEMNIDFLKLRESAEDRLAEMRRESIPVTVVTAWQWKW